MDEITLDGKTYISSKRAAAITGYAKDYVGQLCREGRVEARLVGRSWYVYEPSLAAHKTEDGRKAERNEAGHGEESVPFGRPESLQKEEEKVDLGYGLMGTPINADTSDISSKYNVYSEPKYTTEAPNPLPEFSGEALQNEYAAGPQEEVRPEIKIAEMQNAWQEWFSSAPGEAVPERSRLETPPVPAQERYVREEPAPVPVRKVVGDIEPQHHRREEVPVIVEVREKPNQLPAVKEGKKKPARRSSKARHSYGLIFRAILVGSIILTVSIAFVATGVAYRMHVVGAGNPFLDYLSGQTVLIKDNI